MHIVFKVILFIMVIFIDILSVIFEYKLPLINKDIKWNFETRGLAYSFGSLINFILSICVIVFIKPNSCLSYSRNYFIINFSLALLMFLAVFSIDRRNINKKFKPYVSDNMEEFLKYKDKAHYLNTQYRTFSYAFLLTLTTILFFNTIV